MTERLAELERWHEHMRRGQFEAAWRISDRVRGVWDGTPLAGRRVLVRCDRGIGDTLQFIRYVPLIGADDVTVITRRCLVPLLRRLADPPPRYGVTSLRRRLSNLRRTHDVEIEVMELAHASRTTLSTIPRRVPYLDVDPLPLPPSRAPRVGIAWRSGVWDRRRDVTYAQLARALPGAELYPLDRQHAGSPLRTARLIRALDLVVTVDTMAAHLAGALGVRTWTLLHAQPDWRWLEQRTDSPWYPAMRLFRQTRAGEWGPVLAEVREAFRAWPSMRAQPPSRVHRYEATF